MAKILLVDDDKDMVESLSMVLEGNGHSVSVVYDVDGLVDAVRDVNPDIILLDIVFPDDPQAGFKAARALSRDARVNHIPVLVLSAVNQLTRLGFSFSEKDISEDFLPVAGFLEKPIEPPLLLARIDDILAA
jgi:CheY-like chemotaxis protein